MTNKVYKNLNCKIDKSVSDKLEKFIADTKLSKTATVEKAFNRPIAAVDAPLIAATSQREILIAFLSIIFRIIK